MPNLHFRLMSFSFKLRDFFLPPKNILEEVGIRQGYYVLDYGCGPGSYSVVAAKFAGSEGKVYALDMHPLAVQRVKNIALKKRLTNIKPILSDCATGLGDSSVDVVLLYDTFHGLSEPDVVLQELHRVLKPDGVLSFSDHHMKKDEGISKLTSRGLFSLPAKGKRTYSFSKVTG